MNNERYKIPVGTVGSRFTTLAAVYGISRRSIPVTVLEKDKQFKRLKEQSMLVIADILERCRIRLSDDRIQPIVTKINLV